MWLFDKLQPLYKAGAIPKLADEWIQHVIQNPTITFRECSPTEIKTGKFYFMLYNMGGKTSRLEQFNPVLVVDFKIKQNVPIIWAASLNFIPRNQRLTYFDWFFDRQKTLVLKNEKIENSKNQFEYELDLETMYDSLDQIGYAYAIREWVVPKINKVWEVGIQDIPYFLTFNTEKFTGVDEKKLFEIWLAKLNDRDERKQKKIQELNQDVTKIYKELNDHLLTLEDKKNNLERTMKGFK
jgi:hypothetical protein